MLIPDIMEEEIQRGKTVNVISTTSKWMGVTYREDVIKLKENGAKIITLGKRILRTETVALNVLSIIMYEIEK